MASKQPVRWLGAAKSGTSHFVWQRVTGIVNALFLLIAIAVLARNTGFNHLVYTLSNPFVLAIALVGCFSVLYHMKLGMQVVIEDYVHHHLIRNLILFANGLVILVLAVLVGISLVRLGLVA